MNDRALGWLLLGSLLLWPLALAAWVVERLDDARWKWVEP